MWASWMDRTAFAEVVVDVIDSVWFVEAVVVVTDAVGAVGVTSVVEA